MRRFRLVPAVLVLAACGSPPADVDGGGEVDAVVIGSDAPMVGVDAPAGADAPVETIHRVSITIEAPGAVSQSLRVVLPSTFAYSHAAADGSDLRFSASDDPRVPFDLGYWIERWDPAGESAIWVRVPSAAPGGTFYLYYGFAAGLPAASSFAAAFPSAFESTGTDSLLGGAHEFDAFVVHPGHTVSWTPGVPITVRARYVSIEGRLDGTAAGYGGGTSTMGTGAGPGGGGVGGMFTGDRRGAGGGGHGGAGGSGGSGGAGGAAYSDATGSATNEMGSGGGYSFTDGGRGGGAITIEGQLVRIAGVVDVAGRGPMGSATCCHCPGAGGGGGVLVRGHDVVVSGSLQARGGVGGGSGTGSCGGVAPHGGGGGGGGRIKIFGDAALDVTATFDVAGGGGGFASHAISSSRGSPGEMGTTHTATEAFAERPAALRVGPEETIPR
jgi:hypothetical protein